MNARIWFWWSVVFAIFAFAVAVPLAAIGHTWFVAPDSAFGAADLGLAWFWHRRIPPRALPPSRHDLCLQQIDVLERQLGMGKYAKTQAEFDAEVERVVRPFRYHSRLLLQWAVITYLRRRQSPMLRGLSGTPRWGTGRRGRLSEGQLYGQAVGQMIRAMMGYDPEGD